MNTRTATQLTILLRLLSGKKQILLVTKLLLFVTKLLLFVTELRLLPTKEDFVVFAQFSIQLLRDDKYLLLDIINLCLDFADLIF
jgi:hypothetical protein